MSRRRLGVQAVTSFTSTLPICAHSPSVTNALTMVLWARSGAAGNPHDGSSRDENVGDRATPDNVFSFESL